MQTNPLLIYDGVPGDNNTILLGGFCGEELESDVIVYARSGTTNFYIYQISISIYKELFLLSH